MDSTLGKLVELIDDAEKGDPDAAFVLRRILAVVMGEASLEHLVTLSRCLIRLGEEMERIEIEKN